MPAPIGHLLSHDGSQNPSDAIRDGLAAASNSIFLCGFLKSTFPITGLVKLHGSFELLWRWWTTNGQLGQVSLPAPSK